MLMTEVVEKYKEFYKDAKPHINAQWIFQFPNGYGASVICGPCSYGDEGLYELALISYDEDGEWDLCYAACVEADVLGYLTPDEVDIMLNQIKEGRIYDKPDIRRDEEGD